MITHPSPSDIPDLKTMWKLCFPTDADDFIRFYFNEVYKPDECLVLYQENILVASLQIIPYQIKIGVKIYNAGYISGAMTHPEHRKKGYMQQLLVVAFEEMRMLGFTFSFLIPQEDWLFDFYEKYGYQKAFPKSYHVIDLEDNNLTNDVEIFSEFKESNLDEIYSLYLQFLNQKKNVVLKTKSQFELILKDLYIGEGRMFYVKNKGVAFVSPVENEIIIKEIFYTEENVKSILLGAVKSEFKVNKVMIPDESNKYSGMIKILDSSKYSKTFPKDIYMNMMLD